MNISLYLLLIVLLIKYYLLDSSALDMAKYLSRELNYEREIERQAYSIEIRDLNIFITFDWTIICEDDDNKTKYPWPS